MVNCDCPRCGSSRTQALSVLHANGLRRHSWQADSWFFHRGRLGIGSTRGRGRSQTQVSEASAPPVALSTRFLRSGVSPALIVVLTLTGKGWGFVLAVASLLVVAIVGGIAERDSHARALRRWQSTFRCARCGNEFVAT